MGSGIITVMKSKVWVLGSLGNKTGSSLYLFPKRKKEANLLDFFHLFFTMLENKWAFIFQLLNKGASQ